MPIDDMLALLADDLIDRARAAGRHEAYEQGVRDALEAVRRVIPGEPAGRPTVEPPPEELNWVTAFAIGVAHRREPEPEDARAAVDVAGGDVALLARAAGEAEALDVLDEEVRERVIRLLGDARGLAARG